jgi:hypothetical protein
MSDIWFPIFVRDTRGTEDVFEVYSDYKIKQLKIVIGVRKGIPESNINFIFNGKILNDEICLAEGGVHKNCRIYMVGKML